MNPSVALLQNLASQNNVFYVPDNSYSYYVKSSVGNSRDLPPVFSYYANTGPVSGPNPNKPTLGGTISLASGPNLSGTGAYVNAAVYDQSGNYYIGGNFLTVDGVYCSGIAKWNGTAWSAVGGGFNGLVYALAVDSNGNLYAGGDFTSTASGATALLALAKLPVGGSAWVSVGSLAKSSPALSSGYTTFNSAIVYCLTADNNGNIYVGGNFYWVNNSPAQSLATISACGGLSPLLGSGTLGITGSAWNVYPRTLCYDSNHNILFVGGTFLYSDSSAATGRANLMAVNLSGLTPTVITLGQTATGSIIASPVSALALNCGNLYIGTDDSVGITTNSCLGYINLMSSLVTINDVVDGSGRYIAKGATTTYNVIHALMSTSQGVAVAGKFTATSAGTSTALPLQNFVLFVSPNWVYPAGINSVNNQYSDTTIAVDDLQNITITSSDTSGTATDDHCNILKQYRDYVNVNYGATTLVTLLENGDNVLVYAYKNQTTGQYFVQSSNASNGTANTTLTNMV